MASTAAGQELALTITPPYYPIHVDGYPRFSVTLANTGRTAALLTMPGDGSESKWRTPVIGWSILPGDSRAKHPTDPPLGKDMRCGNVNTIGRDEVFVLNPGESRALKEVYAPRFEKPGRYRVVLYYQNAPELEPSGLPFEPHDVETLALMKKSTPCLVRSNELLLTVLPASADSAKESEARSRLNELLRLFRGYHTRHATPAPSVRAVFRDFYLSQDRGPAGAPWPAARDDPTLDRIVDHSQVDPWGTNFSHAYETFEKRPVILTVRSAGPDRKFNTADDLSATLELTRVLKTPP